LDFVIFYVLFGGCTFAIVLPTLAVIDTEYERSISWPDGCSHWW